VRLEWRTPETLGAKAASSPGSAKYGEKTAKISARNRANFASSSETTNTRAVNGTVGWARTTDLRIHNPAL
jgi:hypothetical protein